MPTAFAPAKLNLLLKVLGRRADGYHELEMVNVSLDLADAVTVDPAPAFALEIAGGSEVLPCDERNIAWRAAAALAPEGQPLPPVRIRIAKRIPVGAGLAGGSTDAAAVLRLLGADRPDLPARALALGADVPYCLDGRPAVVEGIGERIEPFRVGVPLHLVIANPGFPVLTREVFEALAAGPYRGAPSAGLSRGRRLADALGRARGRRDLAALSPILENDLEPVTCRLHPEVADLLDRMRDAGALAARMSGSGPTVYGLFADADAAARAAEQMASHAPFVTTARALGAGPSDLSGQAGGAAS